MKIIIRIMRICSTLSMAIAAVFLVRYAFLGIEQNGIKAIIFIVIGVGLDYYADVFQTNTKDDDDDLNDDYML